MLDPLIGQTIDGRFEVRARLGQGGMGTVYRAWQRSVDREVAVKLMDPMFSADPTAVRRFEREAQLASKLSQPNTVSVIDFGKHTDGRLFIVMELIRGRTLHKIVSTEGAFAVERAARITIQICDALDAAHRLGIIHRDLKLDNVMVLDDPPGRDLVKVLDFGLAKQVGELDPRATGSGIVVGTPRYIAPEVAVGGEMSPAADMYAVGVMLGELVLGKPLWRGDSLSDLLTAKLAPGDVLASVPPPIDSLVRELISSKAHERPSAAAVRERLAMLGSGPHPPRVVVARGELAEATGSAQGSAVTLPRVRRTHRFGAVGIGVCVLVVGALVVIGIVLPASSTEPEPSSPPVSSSAPPRDAAQLDPWNQNTNPALHDAVAIVLVTEPATATLVGPRGHGFGVGHLTTHGAYATSGDVTTMWADGTRQTSTISFDTDRSQVIHQRGIHDELHRLTDDRTRTDVIVRFTGEAAAVARLGDVPNAAVFSQAASAVKLGVAIAGKEYELVLVPDRDYQIALDPPHGKRDRRLTRVKKPARRFQFDATGEPAVIFVGGEQLGTTPLEVPMPDTRSPLAVSARFHGRTISFEATPDADHAFLIATE